MRFGGLGVNVWGLGDRVFEGLVGWVSAGSGAWAFAGVLAACPGRRADGGGSGFGGCGEIFLAE